MVVSGDGTVTGYRSSFSVSPSVPPVVRVTVVVVTVTRDVCVLVCPLMGRLTRSVVTRPSEAPVKLVATISYAAPLVMIVVTAVGSVVGFVAVPVPPVVR